MKEKKYKYVESREITQLIHTYPEEYEIIKEVYEKLNNTERYKKSILKKMLEEIIILNEINKMISDPYNYKTEITLNEKYTNEILKENNINCFLFENELIHNDYKKSIKLLEKTLETETLYIDAPEIINMLPDIYILQKDINEIISDIDNDIIKDCFCKPDILTNGYNFDILSENIINKKIEICKKDIKFTFKNQELKNKTVKYIEDIIQEFMETMIEPLISTKDILKLYKNINNGEIKNIEEKEILKDKRNNSELKKIKIKSKNDILSILPQINTICEPYLSFYFSPEYTEINYKSVCSEKELEKFKKIENDLKRKKSIKEITELKKIKNINENSINNIEFIFANNETKEATIQNIEFYISEIIINPIRRVSLNKFLEMYKKIISGKVLNKTAKENNSKKIITLKETDTEKDIREYETDVNYIFENKSTKDVIIRNIRHQMNMIFIKDEYDNEIIDINKALKIYKNLIKGNVKINQNI